MGLGSVRVDEGRQLIESDGGQGHHGRGGGGGGFSDQPPPSWRLNETNGAASISRD